MTDILHFLILIAVLVVFGFVAYCVYLHKQHIAMTKKLLTNTTTLSPTQGAATVSGATQTVPPNHKF